MTPVKRGRWGTPRVRLWWALPGLAVAGTAVGMAVVVGPTLGEHVTIPTRLVLPATAPAAAQTPVAQHPTKPRHHPAPPPTTTPTTPPTTAVPQTHVVTPRRPLVTATSDDSHETDTGRDRSGVDIQGTDR